MRKKMPYVAAVILLVAAVAWFGRAGTSGIDLIERFPEAEKRTSLESLQIGFDVLDADLGGDRRRAIFAHAFSRITWQVDVPEGGSLETAIGLLPRAWTEAGNGVVFRIGVSDGTTYTELFKQRVDPYGDETDRRWQPVTVDLSPWSGTSVSLIFNVDAGEHSNASHDLAVWGEPRVVSR